ncbi:hypothetical protein VIOR3934_08346 [Vibrio orientalis CIP 102891 = ATCC 33934]|uniref:DUF2861 domain-containing protein n=1 Tax=Vibrio orientalis CIP 102891 = ATCC 33934 TaxID=675816 RepID=C9QFN1_VIBOR|nr:DUF2861 family protein [Vibrio orientalis]EEX94067.1 hypothetical protein VIA_001225 [Vibrio orientalis CIP 102891 = ATCC 33934]EGU52790.1 hypothetical protein VIOR3934_08346 [Vibrio orientalis CIP 102891 = ATCC 33934]
MFRTATLIGALLLSAPLSAAQIPWFESNSPLTQAHKHLLDGDLPGMFTSLVEVWQLEKNESLIPHLNDLFLQSLEVDCGKGLDNKSLPDWINSVVIRRTEIQSPGRDSYRAIVEVGASKELKEISLTRWVSKVLSTDTTLTQLSNEGESKFTRYIKRYNLNSRVKMGLYRVDITATDETSWSSWLLLGEPKAKVSVRWNAKAQWKIEKNALLNRHCPLPKLDTEIYDYVDGTYSQVWGESYDSDYPTSLGNIPVEPGRYVLAVSMKHQRWQGPIIVEQSQIISKTYDVSVDE